MRLMRPAMLLATGLALLAGSAASARTMQQKFEAACAGDVQRLCPATAQDGDAVKACLLQHRPAVSQDCLRFVDASE